MKLVIIAALSRNRVIGKNGRVPWDLPEDMQRFKQLTMGHTVLMGRRTHETLSEPLIGRRNVVLTSHPLSGIETYRSIPGALVALKNAEIVYVIGGGEIFRQMLEVVDEWKLTHVDVELAGDTFFPPYEHLVGTKYRLTAETSKPGFVFRDYARM